MNQLPCWETKYKARSAARAVRNAFSHMVRRALLLLVQQLSVRTHAIVENDNVELNAEWIENDHTGTLQAFTRLFIPLAKNHERTVVFGVGANDGSWSKWTMRLCSEAFCEGLRIGKYAMPRFKGASSTHSSRSRTLPSECAT